MVFDAVLEIENKNMAARTIPSIVRQIVNRFAPDKVILFGSNAREENGPDSDIDLLVILPITGSKFDKCLEIRAALRKASAPLDIVVSTPEEFEWRKDVVGTIEWPASREGKLLYAKPGTNLHGHK